MRLVEGIRGKSFPVAPDFVEHFRIMTVLLAALDKLRLHGVNDILFLLTHSLTQGIALTTGEISQQT